MTKTKNAKHPTPAPRPKAPPQPTEALGTIDKIASGGAPPALRVTLLFDLDATAQRFATEATTFQREGHLVRVTLARVQGSLPQLLADEILPKAQT